MHTHVCAQHVHAHIIHTSYTHHTHIIHTPYTHLIHTIHTVHMPYTHMQTYIGSVIVSVNPYKQIGIYDNDTMEEYRGVNFYELSPHM